MVGSADSLEGASSDPSTSSYSEEKSLSSSGRTRTLRALSRASFIVAGATVLLTIVLAGFSVILPYGVFGGFVAGLVIAGMVLRLRSDPAYDLRSKNLDQQ